MCHIILFLPICLLCESINLAPEVTLFLVELLSLVDLRRGKNANRTVSMNSSLSGESRNDLGLDCCDITKHYVQIMVYFPDAVAPNILQLFIVLFFVSPRSAVDSALDF